MPATLRPRQKNYIGEFTTAELALLPVEKVRRWNWVWNITNARPEIYDGAAWVPFGGGGAGGVNTQHSGVAVDTPATTINFDEGLDATGGLGTTTVDCDWAEVGDLAAVGAANVAGAGTEVPRSDHAHQGVHSIAEQGAAQLFGDVTVSEGANVTLTQFGNDIQIAAAGGGVSGSGVEKPDDFHYFKFAGSQLSGYRPVTGMASQRCIARSETYGNTYYLFTDEYRVAVPMQFLLRIEHLTTTPGSKTALDRCVWDVEIEITGDYVGTAFSALHYGDCCLVIDDTDTLHIIFAGDIQGEGFSGIFDAYLSIAANSELQEPIYAGPAAPPAPMNITTAAERVSIDALGVYDCTHPAAAFTPMSQIGIVGSSVWVTWRQTADLAGEIHINGYDPSAVLGSRYAVLPAVRISPPGLACDYPSIEMGLNGAYVVYTDIIGSGVYFATSPLFDILTWLVSGVPLSAVIAGAPDTDDPMSMCVANCGSHDYIYILIRNTSGQGEKYMVVIADDYLTTGVGASYQVSVYDSSNPLDAFEDSLKNRDFFQLGISKISWAAGENAPVLFVMHYMNMVGLVYNEETCMAYDVFMTIIVPDETDGFIASCIPIRPAAASLAGQDPDDAIPTMEPKVHFAFYEYNRVWDGDVGVEYIYYPLMVFGKNELAVAYSVGVILLQIVLYMKDVPEYPYLAEHGVYGC